MSELKATPGPYVVTDEGFIRQIKPAASDSRLYIGNTVDIPHRDGGKRATVANSHLLAASWDLYHALDELLQARHSSLEVVGYDPVTGDALNREGMAALHARAALAKARGEQ